MAVTDRVKTTRKVITTGSWITTDDTGILMNTMSVTDFNYSVCYCFRHTLHRNQVECPRISVVNIFSSKPPAICLTVVQYIYW